MKLIITNICNTFIYVCLEKTPYKQSCLRSLMLLLQYNDNNININTNKLLETLQSFRLMKKENKIKYVKSTK